MPTSTHAPSRLLDQMSAAAKSRFATDAEWAEASGLPKETLSRLKGRASCDLRTLAALAESLGYVLRALPAPDGSGGAHLPEKPGRDYEEKLLDLAASGSTSAEVWASHGPRFFMGGLAVMLASAKGFERERYLRLAESLHPGVSTPEVFAMWLRQSPVRASRFLRMARKRRRSP